MSGIRRRTLFGALGIGFLSLAVWSQISDIDSGVDSFVQAAMQRDYTLSMGCVLLYTVLLYTMNMLVDLSYSYLDPRVGLE